jgi:crotonobetainyl-CoA:carnitine CoA-transferase CaiB-like acyl-CoA transferase
MRLSATPTELRMAPPILGQHTDEILREKLGLSAQEIELLKQNGVI